MDKHIEDIFRQLLPKDEPKKKEWLIARNFVLGVLPPLDGAGISHDCPKFVHVIVEGYSSKMMAVVRQIALIAHYANYDEETGRNKTVITICIGSDKNPEKVEREIIENGYLGNLLQYCNEKSWLKLDLTFEFWTDDITSYLKEKESDNNEIQTIIHDDDISEIYYDEKIDVYKGMLVNMCYCIGEPIAKLPAYDNSNMERYALALDMYGYQAKSDNLIEKWKNIAKTDANGNYSDYDVKLKLSSLLCSDCFDNRIRCISGMSKPVSEYNRQDFKKVKQAILESNVLNALVQSEHARWNVEKLILGYKPLNEEERYKLEILFGAEKSSYKKRLRKEYSHIDLCSYKELRRINPQDLKYDYFLMLAIPTIMEEWNKYAKKYY